MTLRTADLKRNGGGPAGFRNTIVAEVGPLIPQSSGSIPTRYEPENFAIVIQESKLVHQENRNLVAMLIGL